MALLRQFLVLQSLTLVEVGVTVIPPVAQAVLVAVELDHKAGPEAQIKTVRPIQVAGVVVVYLLRAQ
jgi:hypothetical protein